MCKRSRKSQTGGTSKGNRNRLSFRSNLVHPQFNWSQCCSISSFLCSVLLISVWPFSFGLYIFCRSSIILISWNVIFIWETGYWTRAIKRFALFDLLKSLYSDTNILSKKYFWHLRHRIWYCFDNYFTYFVPVFKYCYSDSRNLWTVMKAGGLAP
jgi:hypothetical protein